MKWISTGDSTKKEQEKLEERFRIYERLPKVSVVDGVELKDELPTERFPGWMTFLLDF